MALAEIQSREQICHDLSKQMRASLDALDSSSRRAQELDILKEQVTEFENALEGIKIELRSTDLSHSDREVYKKKMKELKAILDQLRSDIEWKEKDADRDELIGDRRGLGNGHDLNSEAGLINHGDEILAASNQSLQRSVAAVAATAAIGKDVTTKLQAQTQQMTRQLDDLYEIENTVDRAAAIVRRMARKIATDKYIWVMVFLVFVAIMFIIIWKKVKE